MEYRVTKVYGEKQSSEFNFFVIEKKIQEKSSLKFSAKFTNGFSHECWKNLFVSEKLVLMKIIFHEFFWTTFLSVGVQRTDDRKEKIFFQKACFHWNLFSLKSFNWFGMIHQWVYTRMMIKIEKNSEEKTYTECFFENEFWITLLSGGVQNANIKEIRTVFQVNFFGYREIVSGKSYFVWFGKIYHRGISGKM